MMIPFGWHFHRYGLKDICVADTMGWLRWLTPGDGGPYLPEHRQYLPPRS